MDNFSLSNEIASDEVVRFIGPKYPYYLRKWFGKDVAAGRSSPGDPRPVSINFWAWLGFPVWAGYRKMYLYYWIYLGLTLMAASIEMISGFPVVTIFLITAGIFTLGFSNLLYYIHVESFFKNMDSGVVNLRQVLIERQGDVSIKSAVFCGVGYFVLLVAGAFALALLFQFMGIEIDTEF